MKGREYVTLVLKDEIEVTLKILFSFLFKEVNTDFVEWSIMRKENMRF